MKISPIAIGGTPGVNLGAESTQRTSPERIAAAKAIMAGETPIQVTESDVPVDPQVARINKVRSIKMNTKATVYRDGDPTLQEQLVAQEDPIRPASDPTEQTKAVIEDTKPLSPQFAALAKQRRALQVQEKAIADREKALESRSTNEGGIDFKAKLKSDPLSVLQEAGVTYDDLTNAILASQGNPEIQSLKEEIKALKEGVDKNFIERDSRAEQQVYAEMQREAQSLIKEGDVYEMVRETGSLPEAIELIKRTYKQTGEVLDVSEALSLVEDDLFSESLKIANIKKVLNKLKPEQVQSLPQSQSPKQMRTLTNRDGAQPILSRRDRAIAAALKK